MHKCFFVLLSAPEQIWLSTTSRDILGCPADDTHSNDYPFSIRHT